MTSLVANFSSTKTLLCLMLLLLSLSLFPNYSESACSVNDEQLLRRRRLQGIRANILAQLGMTEPPETPNVTAPVPSAISETFNALAAATKSLSKERTRVCESENVYAQPISAFVGSIEGGAVNSPSKRSVEKDDSSSSLIAEYTMTFDFDLEDDLRDFTRADLLLYQIPITKDAYNSDEQKQHIEIKAIYESLGLVSVVSAKNVDPFERGYQAFDIASAIQTWISQGTHGNVTIKVSVHCYSSSFCNQIRKGHEPQAVSFKDFDSNEYAPRIIVTSRNPLEQTQGRSKRQAESPKNVRCTENQATCCLHNLNISFADDLGFNFIVEPLFYEANYCNGVCAVIHTATPRVYQFITKVQGISPSNLEPCCAGNTFEDIQVLVRISEKKYKIQNISQARITSCRCA